MGLDGLTPANQIMGYADKLGQMVKTEKALAQLHKGNKVHEHDIVHGPSDENTKDDSKPRNWHHGKDQDDMEEELKALFAEQFNLILDPTVSYRFFYNNDTDRFELVDIESGKVLLSLTLEAFRTATDAMRQDDAGMITDRTA